MPGAVFLICIKDGVFIDPQTETHRFLLEGEEQLSIRGGDYILPMDEFWVTLLRDHPDSASAIPQ